MKNWINFCCTVFAVGLSLLYRDVKAQLICPDALYQYTQQPPPESLCNPYIEKALKFDCEIIGADVNEIRWYFSPDNTNENRVLLTNSTKYELSPYRGEGNNTALLLTINDLNAIDVGFYWCQGIVPDGSLTRSISFELWNETEYFFPRPCDFILRRSVPTCASVILSTTAPPPTTLPQTTHPPTTTPLHTPVFTTDQEVTSQAVPVKIFEITESELVLYVVLGLVGFLAIICFTLGIVIVLLCRRRCQENYGTASAQKEIGFDHFSNQSDFALSSSQKFSSPSVGPYQPETTVQTLNSGSRVLSGDYAEIGPALTINNERLHHFHSSYPQPGTHPPLPSPHPMFTSFHSSIEMAANSGNNSTDYENPYDLPDIVSQSFDSVGTNYHVLERVHHQSAAGENRGSSGPRSTTSSFSTPPGSPPYHTLEESASHMTMTSSSTVEENPGHPSHEHRLSRLEPIPEHPYHVLENGSKAPTTSNTECTATSQSSTSTMSATAKSIADREYDKLIGPPHLYHILQHSPSLNKPRIHRFQFSEYDSLEPKQSQTRKEQNVCTLTPSTSPDIHPLTESLSSNSSVEGSAVFDDPQYVFSPEPPQQTVPTGASCTHNRPPGFAQNQRETANLTKYSGDYERDPTYMMRLHSISVSPKLLIPSLKTTEMSNSQDDSGFCCYASSSTELKRQSSLPNIYQALRTDTMELPHAHYQRIVKQHSQPNKTNT